MAVAVREAIQRALAHFGGNRRKVAGHLGIGLRTLYEKLKRYDLG
jgi:two-component system response regulator FlrC